jgi:hypothetical protein
MGLRQQMTGGHLCVDLTNIEMTPDDQQALLAAIQATVMEYLAQRSEAANVITISMSASSGQRAPAEASSGSGLG